MEGIIDALNAANQRVKELQPTEQQIKEAINILNDYMGAENIRQHPQYETIVLMLKSAQGDRRGIMARYIKAIKYQFYFRRR